MKTGRTQWGKVKRFKLIIQNVVFKIFSPTLLFFVVT